MRIVIFGAGGRTGNHLVRHAIGLGHDVTAFVRKPNKLPLSHARMRVVVGDATDEFQVNRAIQGCEAVITTIAPGTTTAEEQHAQILQNILNSMERQNVKRIVAVSDSFVLTEHGFAEEMGRRMRQLFITPSHARWLRASARYAACLRASRLEWTLVCTHHLTDDPFDGQYTIETRHKNINVRVSRANVADFLLRIAHNGSHIHEMPIISNA
jgi:putative NADH-flavin reductase